MTAPLPPDTLQTFEDLISLVEIIITIVFQIGTVSEIFLLATFIQNLSGASRAAAQLGLGSNAGQLKRWVKYRPSLTFAV